MLFYLYYYYKFVTDKGDKNYMALSSQESIFAKQMILHGNKERAVRAAFPDIQDQYINDAIVYIMQNPEVDRHINAGIFYVYKELLPTRVIKVPLPLSEQEQIKMLELVISRTRKSPKHVETEDGWQTIFEPPSDYERAEAIHLLERLTAPPMSVEY